MSAERSALSVPIRADLNDPLEMTSFTFSGTASARSEECATTKLVNELESDVLREPVFAS